MGNYNDITSHKTSTHQNKITKFITSKLHTKFVKQSESSESFFVKYVQLNRNNDIPLDINSLDKRRTVFVSILSLFLTWKKLPSHILYTSIFLLPLKSEWIYHPDKYKNEIKCTLISELTPFSDTNETCEFIQLLKWKCSQGLAFCMLDDYKYPKNIKLNVENQLIAPFWHCLNAKLTQLYDPIAGQKYKPLHLNMNYYQNTETFKSKFSVTPCSILEELYFVKMKFKSLCEIIYQSNPLSLNPVKLYECNIKTIANVNTNYLLEDMDDEDTNNWWISDEYNPFDMDDEDTNNWWI